MRLTLISPRIALQKGDFLGSGVPYWPIELATLAAFLRDKGEEIGVIDLFGSAPGRLEEQTDCYLQGAPIQEYLDLAPVAAAQGFIVYALSYMSHQELLSIVRRLRAARPGVPIAVLENSQAVTACALESMASSFFAAGADALICGEPYFNWDEIARALQTREATAAPRNVLLTRSPEGRAAARLTDKNARYPVPAWDLFPLQGYWSLPYSHGPKTPRFLPILTSRGCPYPCDFCVVPGTNGREWRANAAQDVVAEMIALRDRFGVRHFQVEDLNPTVQGERWDEICRSLLEKDAGIFFYFVSGTKAETVRIEQVPLLARAGCRYISISPESGSAQVLKAIGKRFDHDHGLALVKACREHGVRTQACFLVGHPAETEEDHRRSLEYLRALVQSGLDEVAVFVTASFAGSALFARGGIDLTDPAALPSFSPKGRKDFKTFDRRRREMIRAFFVEKLGRGADLWAKGVRAALGRPQTKMENLPRRVVFILWLILQLRLARLLGGGMAPQAL
ncbi:MAG: radical SAM protein [Elusimicrobiota bacterium]